MLAKLTLTIDDRIVEQAKQYAQKKHRSVSKIVEEYLRTISTSQSNDVIDGYKAGEITDKITGMFKKEYKEQDYKDLLVEALQEKM
jgi:hypothetical protein